MIPKIIHYCWFGGKPLPTEAIECINSWKQFCPNYEIKEWNEMNFDLSCCDYVREAYEAKKWAFVSDYARFWILYNYGGLYFDTDVELIAPIDDIIAAGSYMGSEQDFNIRENDGRITAINSGLGLGMAPNEPILKDILSQYETAHFIKENGSYDLANNVVVRVTEIFKNKGYQNTLNEVQNIAGITIYPREYFCPLNYYTGELNKTKNTRSIHHYSATWLTPTEKRIEAIKAKFSGGKLKRKVGKIICVPYIIKNKIETIGLKGTIILIKNKIMSR